jgi:KDO2-lipid IV(A) lauroyltransferase
MTDGGRAPGPPGLAHDGLLWRRFARFGAAHGPPWFVEHSPRVIGVCAALLLPKSRRAVRDNLRRVRGPVGRLREARDVAETFSTYAGCLSEVLSNGSKNARTPELALLGKGHMEEALADDKGVILVTAHTAGWEVALPLLRAHKGLGVVMVMEPERDAGARELSDRARRDGGTEVAHVAGDPLASLPLLRRLREGGAVALQIDRVPPGMRGVKVRMFGDEGEIPEGPLRLAQLSGAPIVPIFCAREGYRRYRAEMFEPVRVPRRASAGAFEALAQRLADAMSGFVLRAPTQWLDFGHGR